MKQQFLIRILLILLIVLVNVGCDQVSKAVVRERVAPNETIEVIGHNLILTNAENSGAFLSLGSDWPEPVRKLVLLIIPCIALLGAFVMLVLQDDLSRGMLVGLSFAIGGGIGNIYDRIKYGSVTDFLHIDLEFARTGIFNVADMSIMFGLILTLFLYFRQARKEKAAAEALSTTDTPPLPPTE
ncbi:MAG: signal peptidase II [Bacteroidota bacterium]